MSFVYMMKSSVLSMEPWETPLLATIGWMNGHLRTLFVFCQTGSFPTIPVDVLLIVLSIIYVFPQDATLNQMPWIYRKTQICNRWVQLN